MKTWSEIKQDHSNVKNKLMHYFPYVSALFLNVFVLLERPIVNKIDKIKNKIFR